MSSASQGSGQEPAASSSGSPPRTSHPNLRRPSSLRDKSSASAAPYDLDALLNSRGTEGAPAPSQVRQSGSKQGTLDEILDGYGKGFAASQTPSSGKAQKQQAGAARGHDMPAHISRLLKEKVAVPMKWEAGCGPLPGMPDIDWNSVTPTGAVLGKGGFGCVLGFRAMRRPDPTGQESMNGQTREVRLAAKFLLDDDAPGAAAHGAATPADKLADEFNTYRGIVEARHDGKTLGTHPNLCEIYGIVTMHVGGIPMRAMLMEAVPGRDAQATADTLRHCLEANYLNAREYWGAIQYLCDCTLDAAEHLRKAGIVHKDIKQDNVLVRRDGAVKVIDYGLAAKTGDKRYAGTPGYMPKDYGSAGGVTAATDVYAIGATTAEMVDGFKRMVKKEGSDSFAELSPEDGAVKGVIRRGNAHGDITVTPVNQIRSAYSNWVNAALRKGTDRGPLMPDTAKAKDFISDQLLNREEAKAVIRAAFKLADIETGRAGNARWLPQKDARNIAKRLIRNEQLKSAAEVNRSDVHDGRDLMPPELSAFFDKPDLGNYLSLKRHYQNTPNQEQKISEILTSLPDGKLNALNEAISRDIYPRAQTLLENGSWLTEFKKSFAASDASGMRQDPAAHPRQDVRNSGRQTHIENLLHQNNKSIDDLRAYITEAAMLFKDLKSLSHPLTLVEWEQFTEVGSLTKFALGLNAKHVGIQAADLEQKLRHLKR